MFVSSGSTDGLATVNVARVKPKDDLTSLITVMNPRSDGVCSDRRLQGPSIAAIELSPNPIFTTSISKSLMTNAGASSR